MGTPHSQRVEEVFSLVVEEPPDRHQRLLDELCQDDRRLRAEVEALLAADAAGHPLFERQVGDLASQLLDATVNPPPPERFGRYVIQSHLSEGGMGSVYLARRDDLGDLVAVKFLRDGWTSPARQHRFAAEQRTLAALTHPNIARLYDAGVTGRTPWFSMEYVRGAVSIVEYCQTAGLELRERLVLFRAACEAVSYAHRNLTVHLDLKPSNILVDGAGEVKLVDFGIARHLSAPDGAADQTAGGHRALSLNYASPEQIRGETLDVQTDVYALGAVLYELVAGRPAAQLHKLGTEEIARWLESEPPAPSRAVNDTPVATVQSSAPVRASSGQWRDLDVLCATAMRRQRPQRYRSVDQLIVDVDHFLAGEPLEARGPARAYRLGKFVTRHRRSVATAAAALLGVAALSTFFTLRLIEARDRALSSEARAQRINRLMLGLFEGDDSAAGPAAGLRVVSLLDRGVREADGMTDDRALQAELRYTLGGLYHKLGHLDRAEPLLTAALQARESQLGRGDVQTLRARQALAALRVDQSRLVDAERVAREAVEAATARFPASGVEVATASATLGKVLAAKGDYDAAVALLEPAVGVLSAGAPSAELSEAIGDLANTRYYLGDIAAAADLNQRALILDRDLLGPRHPNVGVDLYNLANIQLDRAGYAEAERLFREALAIDQDWYGEAHPKTASNLMMLGRTLVYQRRLDEAAPFYERALASFRSVYPEEHIRIGAVLSVQGDLARERGRLDAADAAYSRAAEIFKATIGEKHEFYLIQLTGLGAVLLARGRPVEAERLLRPAVAGLTAAVPGQRYEAIGQTRLAETLAARRMLPEAERFALAAYETLRASLSPRALELQDARRTLAAIYTARGLADKAAVFEAEFKANAAPAATPAP